jgi:hypothetical protein
MYRQIDANDRVDTQDVEAQNTRAANPEANDGLKIDEILQRAQEIHRENGGMFGYDFEDWLEAWGELPERDD